MRNIRYCLFVLVFACPLTVFAADIYGKVWVSPGLRPASNATVEIRCPADFKTNSIVDKYGRYRLTQLPAKNNCQFSITHNNTGSGEVDVYSGTGSKSMNIEILKSDEEWKVVVH